MLENQLRNIALRTYIIMMAGVFFIPSGVSAGNVQVMSSSGNPTSASIEVVFSDYPADSILITVGAGAGGGSQQGTGRGYHGYADATIGTSVVVDDQPVAGDGGMVSAYNSMTITKDASGNWMNGSVNMGTSVWISGQANFDGEDCVCNGGVSGDVSWIDTGTGTITLTSNIPGASFTLTGPASITGTTDFSGNISFFNRPIGAYTLTWSAVSGYTTPGSSSFTLISGGTQYANSYYIPTGMCRTGDVQQCGDFGVPPCDVAPVYPVNNGGPEGILYIQDTSGTCSCSGGNTAYLPDYSAVPLCAAPPVPPAVSCPTATSANFSWGPIAGATGYRLWVGNIASNINWSCPQEPGWVGGGRVNGPMSTWTYSYCQKDVGAAAASESMSAAVSSPAFLSSGTGYEVAPLNGSTVGAFSSMIQCPVAAPPTCVLGSSNWAGLTAPNFGFGGAASGESERIKDSLCPAGQAMIGSRSYQYTRDVDEEYEEALCAAGVTSLGASHRVEAPNAFNYENPGTKTALCPAGEVMVGVRMYGVYASVDEEHVDAYCAPLPSATLNAAASHWVNGSGATLFGSFKSTTCPANEIMTGIRWFQWPSNLDEEHTDIQCTPVSLVCGPTATIIVAPGAVVGVETPSLWQRVWNYILGRDSVAHAAGSANILVNQEGVVTWSSSGVSDCSITSVPGLSGFPINLTTGGSYTIPSGVTAPGQSYTFTMTCSGASGGATDSATLSVTAASDFKVCPTSATIGTTVSTQLRAFYETVGAVDCGNTAGAIEVTTDPSTNWSSANAGIASVNNGASKGLATGVSAGTTNITATYLTNSNSSSVTVSCAPSNSCASAGSVDTAANTCTGQTFNINDGCGATITCNGTRTCDFNWKEIGQ